MLSRSFLRFVCSWKKAKMFVCSLREIYSGSSLQVLVFCRHSKHRSTILCTTFHLRLSSKPLSLRQGSPAREHGHIDRFQYYLGLLGKDTSQSYLQMPFHCF